jgi:HlyD family secretion protein
VRLAATELQNVVTYTVIIEARNEDRRLYPGMTANVQIETARRHGVLRVSNDALRFRPRETAAAPPQTGAAQAAERGERLLTQLRTSLKLSDEQAALVQDVMHKAAAARAERQKARQEQGEGGGGNGGEGAGAGENRAGNARSAGEKDGGPRNRFMERIEAVLEPTLTDEQKPLLERWRQARQSGRMATIWLMGLDRKPEQRQVRLGISDEQFAELVGGGLKQGDSVITRQRQVAKR